MSGQVRYEVRERVRDKLATFICNDCDSPAALEVWVRWGGCGIRGNFF